MVAKTTAKNDTLKSEKAIYTVFIDGQTVSVEATSAAEAEKKARSQE